jgi:hypothetical protein
VFIPKLYCRLNQQLLEFEVAFYAVDSQVRVTYKHSYVRLLASSERHVPNALRKVRSWYLVAPALSPLGLHERACGFTFK